MTEKTKTADEVFKALTGKDGKVIYTLRDVTVTGMFDLRYQAITKALDIQNCVFTDVVDFSYCEFNRRVVLSGTEFQQSIRSANTTYKQGLLCNDTIFQDKIRNTDFLNAKFGGDLDCGKAVFKGGVRFQGVTCSGTGFFWDTQFENEEKIVDFSTASFAGQLDCDGAVFRGGVSFAGLQCSGSGLFRETQFENLEHWVDFLGASFKGNLDCNRAVFKGGVGIQNVQCAGSGFFRDTHFENERQMVDFLGASFGKTLDCDRAVFKGEVRFQGVQCGGNGYFRETQFENEKYLIDFGLTSFKTLLQFKDITFRQAVGLKEAAIKRLDLQGISFSENGKDLKKKGKVDLRGCVIEIFPGSKEDNLKFIEAQDPKYFNYGPFIQLEKYYRVIGDETEAERIYVKGRDALRQHARKLGTGIHWSRKRRVGEWLLDVSVKYGTRTRRLLGLILIFLALGVFIYWGDGALAPSKAPPVGTPAAAQTIVQKIVYVIDLFLPVKLNMVDRWQPVFFLGEVYAIILIVCGWLFIPLLIASLSGYLRRKL
jgi:hypothetical protein